MNLKKIALENDIYLYYWIYYMKPIFVRNNTYEQFLRANSWVEIPKEQKKKNLLSVISQQSEKIPISFAYEKKFEKSLKMRLKGIPNGMTK